MNSDIASLIPYLIGAAAMAIASALHAAGKQVPILTAIATFISSRFGQPNPPSPPNQAPAREPEIVPAQPVEPAKPSSQPLLDALKLLLSGGKKVSFTADPASGGVSIIAEGK